MIDLRNIDCMELMAAMADKCVDILLTDPPYGMEFQSNARKVKLAKIENDDNLDWLPEWIKEIRRVVKDDSHLYIWCSWHKIEVFKSEFEKHFEIKNLLVWHKQGGGMGDLKGGYGGCHELCLFINNGKDLKGKRDVDVIDKAYRTGNEYHPTQKPVNLMEYFIEKSSNEGDLVFDSFAGSGSTAIACYNTKRNFIGAEINKEFYDVAMKRIQIEMSQSRLF